MNLKKWLPLVIVIGLFAIFWQGLRLDPHTLPSTLIGRPLPHFELPTFADNHLVVSNKDMTHHVSILHVFASWCGTCGEEQPLWVRVAKNNNDFVLYGLAYKDKSADTAAWLQQFGNPFKTIAWDEAGKVALDLGVNGTPETFIMDKEGIVQFKLTGPLTENDWQQVLLPLIKRLNAE